MVVNRRLATSPDDEDSSQMPHPIDEFFNHGSWVKDDNGSAYIEGDVVPKAYTEDDELQKEIDILSSIEREVSRELSDLVRSYPNRQEKQMKRSNIEIGPRRMNSPISPMNEVYTEVMKREDKYLLQEKMEVANQETIRLRSKKKWRADISNIQEVDIGMIIKDSREFSGRSQPSDEACNGTFGASTREPPEEIFFIDNEFYGDDIDSIRTDEIQSIYKEIDINLFTSRNNPDQLTMGQQNGGEESAVRSEWSPRYGKLFDIERGGEDIFDEQSFWEDGFWKTPIDERTSQLAFAPVQQQEPNEGQVQEGRKIPPTSKSRQAIIDTLSLPPLDHCRNNGMEALTKIAQQLIGSHQKNSKNDEMHSRESKDDEMHSWESKVDEMHARESKDDEMHSRGSIVNELHSTDSKEFELLPWKSEKELSSTIENQHIMETQTQEISHRYALHTAQNGEGASIANKEWSQGRYDFCNWRVIVLAIHSILTICGIAVFWSFFKSKDLQD